MIASNTQFRKNNSLFAFSSWLKSILGSSAISLILDQDSLVILTRKEFICYVSLFFKLHSHCLFNLFSDLSCSDFFIQKRRVELCYKLLSVHFVNRVSLKVSLSFQESIESLSSIFTASNWFEREAFDLFGVLFRNHSDLRRILTDYGFDGYPLRKDFPVSGYTETFFDFRLKRVICVSLLLSQDPRWIGSSIVRKNWNCQSNFYFINLSLSLCEFKSNLFFRF